MRTDVKMYDSMFIKYDLNLFDGYEGALKGRMLLKRMILLFNSNPTRIHQKLVV